MDTFLKIQKEKYAVIGDSHGCYYELKELIENIWSKYGEDTFIVSVGDNIDRGDYNLKTLKLCMNLFYEGKFIEVQSNHMNKFIKWLYGKNVKVSYGMQKTVQEFNSLSNEEKEKLRKEIIDYYNNIPLYLIVNDNESVVAHAGIKDNMIGKVSNKIKSFVLYGETTGRFLENGFPERLDWTLDRKVDDKSPKIIYGHVVYNEPYINKKCYGIDTGCVLGNKLTAYLPKEDKFEFVKAKKKYYTF